jgi:hypothetical protein
VWHRKGLSGPHLAEDLNTIQAHMLCCHQHYWTLVLTCQSSQVPLLSSFDSAMLTCDLPLLSGCDLSGLCVQRLLLAGLLPSLMQQSMVTSPTAMP